MYSKDIFKNMKCPCPEKGCNHIVESDSLAEGVIKACRHYMEEHNEC